MQKTKLGISIGLTGAAMYFLGAISIIPAFLLAAYVLLMEDNDWLKKSAVKMMAIVIVFGALSVGVDLVQDVFGVLRGIVGIFADYANVRVPLNLDTIAEYIIAFCKSLLLILMGFKALTMGTMKVGFLDKIISKHM